MAILPAKEVQDKLTGIIDELRSRTNGPENGDLTEVVGAINEYDGSTLQARYYKNNDQGTGYVFDASMGSDCFVKSGSVYADVDKTAFGNATASYVAEGHWFTSENGFNIEGTMPIYDGSPIGATHVNTTDTDFVFAGLTVQSMIEDEVSLKVSKSDFGDAKASDVRKGKRFTSADGVYSEGTYEAASVKTCTVNVTFSYNPRNYMISATTYANGAFSNSITRASTGASVSIPNVVCGSVLTFSCSNSFAPTWSGTYQMGGDQNSCAAIVPSNSGTYTLDIGMLDD